MERVVQHRGVRPRLQGTFGNAGRNTVIGPRNNIADFSVVKSTRISERINLQFRAEFFNILNHPNFALPNVTVNSSAFGTIASTPTWPTAIRSATEVRDSFNSR